MIMSLDSINGEIASAQDQFLRLNQRHWTRPSMCSKSVYRKLHWKQEQQIAGLAMLIARLYRFRNLLWLKDLPACQRGRPAQAGNTQRTNGQDNKTL